MPVDPAQMAHLQHAEGFAGRKYRLTRCLLLLRGKRIADLRGPGATRLVQAGRGYSIRRETASGEICVGIDVDQEPTVHLNTPVLQRLQTQAAR